MKNNQTYFLLALFIILACTCRRETAIESMHFRGYTGNPILIPGPPGSWDDMYVINAFELIHHDTIFMFYTAYSQRGGRAVGLATSTDGYNFTKFGGNPILEGDGSGYNAFGVAQTQVLPTDTGWVLYFNAREIVGFSCGQYIGRARARSLAGPWISDEDPVLSIGKKGEWDAGLLLTGTVLYLGEGYAMYYHGADYPLPGDDKWTTGSIGFATSRDGIRWEKYRWNPVYTLNDDPYSLKLKGGEAIIQSPKLLFTDSLCFMYYDYGHGVDNGIGVAVCPVDSLSQEMK